MSAHNVHINLNTVFYTHIEDSPTKTIYIGHMETHTDTYAHTCARTDAHTMTVAETGY